MDDATHQNQAVSNSSDVSVSTDMLTCHRADPRETRQYLRRRRWMAGTSLLVLLLLSAALTWFLYRVFVHNVKTPEQFREYIASFGWTSRLVFLGIQCLQVVVALIPGEVIEVGAGYAFGPVEGTLLCMAGVALASLIIFGVTKKIGVRWVEAFISREKIDDLRFINSESKLKRLIFILYFIPGTPKDLFTYFAGLTRIQWHEFLVISLIARIPSVVSSTIGGSIINSRDYLSAAILFAVTGVVSLGGMLLYSRVVRHYRHKRETLAPTDAA